MNAPVSVMETAGEGGAWGAALLAAYMKDKNKDESLGSYLAEKVFADAKAVKLSPDPEDVKGFDAFIRRYAGGLAIERAAVDNLR